MTEENRTLEETITEGSGRLTPKEVKTIERLTYTLIGGIGATIIGGVLGAIGLEEHSIPPLILGGGLITTYAGFMYPPFVPARDNKYRQLKKRYLEELKKSSEKGIAEK